jgi:hypothetical protein
MANMMKDVLVYRHADTGHFLLSTTLSFPPRWENKQNLRGKEIHCKKYKGRLLNYGNIKWLRKKWVVFT